MHLIIVAKPEIQTECTELIADYECKIDCYKDSEVLLSQKETLDPSKHYVFLLDDQLPGMNCFQLVQQLAQDFQASQFCLFCGEYNANQRDVSKEIGVTAWVDKPLQRETLISFLTDIEQGKFYQAPREKLPFNVKPGRLVINHEKNQVFFEGTFDDGSWLDRILDFNIEEPIIHFDFAKVTSINIEGVKAWSNFAQKIPETICYLHNCPVQLIEFLNMMPDFFHYRAQVMSFHVPVYNHESFENETCLIEVGEDFSGSLKKLVESEVKNANINFEIGCDLDSFLSFGGTAEEGTAPDIWISYLQYFAGVNRNALMEMQMTQTAVLDQSSKIVGRFSCFTAASKVLPFEFSFPEITRRDIIPKIIGTYGGIIQLVDSVSEVIRILTMKWLRVKTMDDRFMLKDDFQKLLVREEDKFLEELRNDLKESQIDQLEQSYNETLEEEKLLAMTMACLGVLAKILKRHEQVINGKGVSLLQVFHDVFQSEVASGELAQFAQKVAEGEIELSEKNYLEYSWEAAVSWDQQSNDVKVFDLVRQTIDDLEVDFSRVMTVMMAHDLVSQLFEHRIFEISMWQEQTPIEQLIEGIGSKLVTVIEKAAYSFYFSDFDATEPAEAVDMNEITFF